MARRRIATEAERALWHGVTADVRRLRPPSEPLPAEAGTAPEPVPETVPPTPDEPPARLRKAPGAVDDATLQRLKRGRVTIEARIDLHGLTQAEAFPALLGFVDSAHRNGKRTLLVITGKGPSAQGGGVLRRQVPHWLAASPLSARILAVVPAQLRHGGEGAFYVLLRRIRR